MRLDIVDLSHYDDPIDFHALQSAGVKGCILKATEGAHYSDVAFKGHWERGASVFGPECIHAYHFLNGDDALAQMKNFVKITEEYPVFHWLDYENPACSMQHAVNACHILAGMTGRYPGMYGSDKDLLGKAIDAGHFAGACPLWIARYGPHAPDHACSLWQYAAGEGSAGPIIAGKRYDCNQYIGDGTAADWMKSLSA